MATPTPTPTVSESPTIRCPNCKKTLRLSDAVLSTLLESERSNHTADLERVRTETERELRGKAQQWAADKSAVATKEAEDLRRQMGDLTLKLTEAQQAQADAIRLQTQLADERRELELTVARRVQQGADAQRQEAQRVADESAQLKIAEKDEHLRNLQNQIEELKRRAETGNSALRGEAQEVVLETLLADSFPQDKVTPVAKGVSGGDVCQQVLGPSGPVGVILYESKRTKTWLAAWLPKLRTDQRAAKAEVAVIVTQAMPEGVSGFGLVDGVWVCEFRFAIPLAVALRQGLIEVAAARVASVGQQTKAKAVYAYLVSPQFKMRITAIVERLSEMNKDLDTERNAVTRIWAKRERQIRGIASATAGFYGDIQGIAGAGVGELEGLKLVEAAGA